MTARLIAAVACFALAALAGISGVSVVSRGPGIATPLGFGNAVGAFLPALGLTVLGLWLLQRKLMPPK
jgi:hypothetical protein